MDARTELGKIFGVSTIKRLTIYLGHGAAYLAQRGDQWFAVQFPLSTDGSPLIGVSATENGNCRGVWLTVNESVAGYIGPPPYQPVPWEDFLLAAYLSQDVLTKRRIQLKSKCLAIKEQR